MVAAITESKNTAPVALVTGSGKRRIGSHVADALADRGFRLVVHYRHSANAATEQVKHFQERGTLAVAIPADLNDETQVRHLIEGALERFGRLDAVVNCAAVWQARLEEVKAADVRLHFETNTIGTFFAANLPGWPWLGKPTEVVSSALVTGPRFGPTSTTPPISLRKVPYLP